MNDNLLQNALVLCMDEKAGIQALDRTQVMLPLRAGKPRTWRNEYVRHGTQTMLAAVDVGTGKAAVCVNKTRKSAEFVTLQELAGGSPDKVEGMIREEIERSGYTGRAVIVRYTKKRRQQAGTSNGGNVRL